MDDKQFAEILKRLESISVKLSKLVEIGMKPEPLSRKIANGIATAVTILGIIGIVETLKIWLGG